MLMSCCCDYFDVGKIPGKEGVMKQILSVMSTQNMDQPKDQREQRLFHMGEIILMSLAHDEVR